MSPSSRFVTHPYDDVVEEGGQTDSGVTGKKDKRQPRQEAYPPPAPAPTLRVSFRSFESLLAVQAHLTTLGTYPQLPQFTSSVQHAVQTLGEHESACRRFAAHMLNQSLSAGQWTPQSMTLLSRQLSPAEIFAGKQLAEVNGHPARILLFVCDGFQFILTPRGACDALSWANLQVEVSK